MSTAGWQPLHIVCKWLLGFVYLMAPCQQQCGAVLCCAECVCRVAPSDLAMFCAQDLIEKSGYFGGGNFQVLTDNQWHMLNTKSDTDRDKGLIAAVGILMRAFEDWHIENTLAFVRSGGDGFDPNQTKDWREFVRRNNNHDDLLKDTEQYMSNIKTYLLYIDQNPSLFWDKYRPDILLKHK